MENRNYTSSVEHRFGYQNQEEDPEFWGGAVAYKYRAEDPRIIRFGSTDPLAREYAYNSSYAFSENRLIDGVELEGLEVVLIGGNSSVSTPVFVLSSHKQLGINILTGEIASYHTTADGGLATGFQYSFFEGTVGYYTGGTDDYAQTENPVTTITYDHGGSGNALDLFGVSANFEQDADPSTINPSSFELSASPPVPGFGAAVGLGSKGTFTVSKETTVKRAEGFWAFVDFSNETAFNAKLWIDDIQQQVDDAREGLLETYGAETRADSLNENSDNSSSQTQGREHRDRSSYQTRYEWQAAQED